MDTLILFLFATALLFLSGAFSGLNIGMMMARPDDLKRKARHGDKIAARVYKYRRDGHYLIFCILLGNVGVNTAMSILLGNVTSGVVGGILATALITTFGEILPQAIFSQRGYRFVRHFFWLLDVIYVVFWPLALPVSRLLTKWVGKEPPQLYTHQELEQILHEHAASRHSLVDYDESQIAAGALRFSKKTARDVATAMDEVYSVALDDEVDATMVAQFNLFVVMNDEEQVGIITLEDVIEEILNREIEDEFDAE